MSASEPAPAVIHVERSTTCRCGGVHEEGGRGGRGGMVSRSLACEGGAEC